MIRKFLYRKKTTDHNPVTHSDELDEIMSRAPKWVLNWGITMILVILVVIFIGTWFIKYPDILSAQITLTTDIPPAKIISRTEGRIMFFIDNGDTLVKGQMLGVIENTANTSDVLSLISTLETYKTTDFEQFIADPDHYFNETLQLGSIQDNYNEFIKSLKNIRLYNDIDNYTKKKKVLTERIITYTELNEQLKAQQKLLHEEFLLTEKKLNNHQKLYSDEVISEQTFDEIRRSYLQSKRVYENSKVTIINNEISISTLQEQLIQLNTEFKDHLEKLKFSINDNYRSLIATLNNWKQKYLLESPIEGIVTFINYWKNGQYIDNGETVMIVVPINKELMGRVKMPVAGSGKVKKGQYANIRFENYPDKDFGIVKGQVDAISLVPDDNFYTIILTLPNGLVTSYNKQLIFKHEMSGTAEIITEDYRLIERIFDNLRSLLDS